MVFTHLRYGTSKNKISWAATQVSISLRMHQLQAQSIGTSGSCSETFAMPHGYRSGCVIGAKGKCCKCYGGNKSSKGKDRRMHRAPVPDACDCTILAASLALNSSRCALLRNQCTDMQSRTHFFNTSDEASKITRETQMKILQDLLGSMGNGRWRPKCCAHTARIEQSGGRGYTPHVACAQNRQYNANYRCRRRRRLQMQKE